MGTTTHNKGRSRMSGLAKTRLMQERKSFRRDHPVGFFARPATDANGEANLLKWHCGIPGPEGTIWEGCTLPLVMTFGTNYPSEPPHCAFPAGFFHPNIYPSGKVCLSIINNDPDQGGAWKPSVTIKAILVGIQSLLIEPNNGDAAQQLGYDVYRAAQNSGDWEDYNRRVKAEV